MGTTPIYAIPYTEPADAVATYPATDKAAMLAVEAALATYATPRAIRYKSTAQTLTTAGTWYTLTYEVDDGSSGITYNAGVFTVPRSGVYGFSVAQHFQASSGNASLRINVGGANYGGVVILPTTGNSTVVMARTLRLVANDQVTIQANHTVASVPAYGSAGTRYSFSDITLIAP